MIAVILSLFTLVAGVATTTPPTTSLALAELPRHRRHRLLAARAGPLRVRRPHRAAGRPRRRRLSALPLGLVTTVAVLLAAVAYLLLGRRPAAAPTSAAPLTI